MLDIKFLRENPDVVKQNIKNKFQDRKLPLVDQVIELDKENREIKQEVQALRADRNKLSKQIGALMGQGKKEEAEEVKKQVTASADRIEELSEREKVVEEKVVEEEVVEEESDEEQIVEEQEDEEVDEPKESKVVKVMNVIIVLLVVIFIALLGMIVYQSFF